MSKMDNEMVYKDINEIIDRHFKLFIEGEDREEEPEARMAGELLAEKITETTKTKIQEAVSNIN